MPYQVKIYRHVGVLTLCLLLNIPALAGVRTTVEDIILSDIDTTGSSGLEGLLYDEGNSAGKSGLKGEDYHVFPLPIQRYFEDFDPEEDVEATRHHQTTYAVVLIPRDWTWKKRNMPKGIYHVKLGAFNAGSLSTHLVWTALPPTEKAKTLKQRLNQRQAAIPMVLTLVLKQQGRVKAVLRVNAVTTLKKMERKLPRNTGWVTYPTDQPDNIGMLFVRGKHFMYQAKLQ